MYAPSSRGGFTIIEFHATLGSPRFGPASCSVSSAWCRPGIGLVEHRVLRRYSGLRRSQKKEVLTVTVATDMQAASHLIAGEVGAPARSIVVENPADTATSVGTVGLGTNDDIDNAVAAAHDAWDSWRTFSPARRAACLTAAAARIAERESDLARTLTLEQGKPYGEALVEIRGSIRILRYYAGLATFLEQDAVLREDPTVTALEGLRPLGVTGIIVPWNSPVYLGMLGTAPALLAGNTVVVKPSEFAPLALTAFLRELAKEVPAGVLNIVQGGASVGAGLSAHPNVRKIFFTGSTNVGRSVLAAGAPMLKRISLELGGNDPAIVLPDAELDVQLFREMTLGVFVLSGQVCFNIKRVYVHRSRYEEFVDGFSKAIDSAITVGDGLSSGTTMGPLATSAQFRKVVDLIDNSVEGGAEVHELGSWHDDLDPSRGYFLRPRLVTGAAQDSPLVQEEQFGPVIPVAPFDSTEEAVHLANDTRYGLAASLWTRDPASARSLARRLEAGSVFINAHRIGASAVDMTFGGFKDSGLGRGHGVAAVRACSETQLIADWSDPSAIPAPY
ncbi:aldehyde dehydrogenase family protein [Streptomyces canus]|uniref:aldehyde dehydrogenase family protein n=1 Tax=Streptomyces canus TaxID=58343 RepID=UPI0009A1342B|nr:aldehyde dehydrogenase family protein [Streptomyces canus]